MFKISFKERSRNLYQEVNLSKKSIPEILSIIPLKDKQKLDYFFRKFFVTDFLGYVLFGEKPCAFTGFNDKLINFNKNSRSISWPFIIPSNLRFRTSYKTWIKYKDYFSFSNFLIKEEVNPWTGVGTLIVIINKHLFLKTVKANIDDFERVLKRKVSLEELWKQVLEKPLFSEVLKSHDGLIGTVLGYGRNNSFEFHKKSFLNQPSILKNPWENCSTYEQNNKDIQKISFFNQFSGNFSQDLRLTFLPGFMAIIDSSETNQILKKYLICREKMLNFYKDKNFLETTLKLLTQIQCLAFESQTP